MCIVYCYVFIACCSVFVDVGCCLWLVCVFCCDDFLLMGVVRCCCWSLYVVCCVLRVVVGRCGSLPLVVVCGYVLFFVVRVFVVCRLSFGFISSLVVFRSLLIVGWLLWLRVVSCCSSLVARGLGIFCCGLLCVFCCSCLCCVWLVVGCCCCLSCVVCLCCLQSLLLIGVCCVIMIVLLVVVVRYLSLIGRVLRVVCCELFGV